MPPFNERQPEVAGHWQIFARFNFTWPDLGALQNEKDEQKTFDLLAIFLLSFVIKKKKKRTEINCIKMLNLIFVHPIYIGREELLQKIIARPCTIVTFIFKDIKLYKN